MTLSAKTWATCLGIDQVAGLAVLDDFGRAARPHGDDGKPRRHGFENHVAEGLGKAGEGKQVGRRVVVGQVVARLVADQVSVRTQAFFEFGSGRSIAHDQGPAAGTGLRARASDAAPR